MSCNCFDNLAKRPDNTLSFKERLDKSKCSCGSRLSVREKRSKFSISDTISVNLIDKYKIDGYFDSSSENRKCDYLFTYKEASGGKDAIDIKSFIFVELKGCDIRSAYMQLKDTIESFYLEGILKNKRVRAAIVFSHYPKDNGTCRKLKKQLQRSLYPKIKDWNLEEMSMRMTYCPITDTFFQ
jgi:hypothetical protein